MIDKIIIMIYNKITILRICNSDSNFNIGIGNSGSKRCLFRYGWLKISGAPSNAPLILSKL